MKRYAAILVSLALAAACSPPSPDQGSLEEGQAEGDPASAGLQACSGAPSDGQGNMDTLTPCRIDLAGDGAFLRVSYAVAAGPQGETAGERIVDVLSRDGAVLQTLREQAESIFYPEVKDLDGDELEDVLIPLMTGNVNTTYALYLQRSDEGFVRAGELGGVSIERTPSGYISASGRSSAVEWETSYYRVTGNQLEEVARVSTTPEYEDETGGLHEETCTILSSRDDALQPEDLCPSPSK
jgi:hypothetical protein